MLREVRLNIGVEKIDMYEDITVEALLDSSVIEMFMDRKFVETSGFYLKISKQHQKKL